MVMNIFISCVSKKRDSTCKACELYISDLFVKSLAYAKTLNGHIRIFSAKYGVLELDDIVSPYNITLNLMNEAERKKWANKVIIQLQEKKVDFNEKTIFLVGKNYRKYLISYFSNYEIPLKGLPIGKQLAWYNNQLMKISDSYYNKTFLW